MDLETTHPNYIDIGCWQLNTATQTISNAQESKELEPLLFKALMYFIQNQNRIITRQELAQNVWQLNFVDDNTINRVIFELRKQLASDLQPKPVIKTHYRKGYSFTVPLEDATEPPPEAETPIYKKSKVSKPYKYYLIAFTGFFLAAIAITLYVVMPRKTSEHNHQPPQATTFNNQILSWYRGHHGKLYNSPDQRYLAYSFKSATNEANALGEIRLMDLTTQHEKVLSIPTNSSILGWSADSNWIYYLHQAEQDSEQSVCEYRKHRLSPNTNDRDQVLFPCSGGSINAIFDFGQAQIVYSRWGYLGVPNLGAIYRYDLNTQQETRITTPSNHGFGDRLLAIIPDTQQLIFTRNIGDKVELLVTTLNGHKTLKLAEYTHLLWAANWDPKQKTVLWFDHDRSEIKRYSMQTLTELPPVKVAVEPTSYVLPMSKSQLLMTTYGYDHDSYVIDLKTGESTAFAKPKIYEVIMAYLGEGEFAYTDSLFKDTESYSVIRIDQHHRYSPITQLSAGYSITDSDPTERQILVKQTVNKVAQVRALGSLDILYTMPDNEKNGDTRLYNNRVAQLRAHEITDDKIIEVISIRDQQSKTFPASNIVGIDWYDDTQLVTLSSNRDIALLNVVTTEVTPLISGEALHYSLNGEKVRPMITAANGDIYLYNRQSVFKLNGDNTLETVWGIKSAVNADSGIYYLDAHGDKLLISYITRYHNEIKLYQR